MERHIFLRRRCGHSSFVKDSKLSLIGCGSIHQGHEGFSDDSRGRQEIFMCLAALLYEQFLPIREWRCQDIDQVLLNGDHFFFSQQ